MPSNATLIPDTATFKSIMLAADKSTVGGTGPGNPRHYKLAPNTDYCTSIGDAAIYWQDFSAHPIEIWGQGNSRILTSLQCDGVQGVGFHLVTFMGYDTGATVSFLMDAPGYQMRPVQMFFERCTYQGQSWNSATGIFQGSAFQLSGTYNIDLKVTGHYDPTIVDCVGLTQLFGLSHAYNTNGYGIHFEGLAVDQYAVDCMTGSGGGIWVNKIFAKNGSNGPGDHPDFFQLFGQDGVRNVNIKVTNCCVFRGNEAYSGLGTDGIFLAQCDNVLIQGNAIHANGQIYGCSIADCTNVTVDDNLFDSWDPPGGNGTGTLTNYTGGDMFVRYASQHVTLTNNKWIKYTQIDTEPTPCLIDLSSGNATISVCSSGTDYATNLNPWLATHPNNIGYA